MPTLPIIPETGEFIVPDKRRDLEVTGTGT
jgi:hypothetical protein